ncbi:MAG: hypothetical protein KF780_11430 [Sphingomonas sp.]|nr:hypothetical protein [Sphingomonas sp.]
MNGLSLFAATAVLALADLGTTQSFVPRTQYEDLVERPKPMPEIPAHLRSILSASSPDQLLVRDLHGRDIPVDIEWYEPEDFVLLRDGRYLGFALQGYEGFGYLLIDRAANGEAAVIATGEAPLFSPDGRFFVALQQSDAGWGNLEGVGLWEVRADMTFRRFYNGALPYAYDWRLDGWVRPDCVALSAVLGDWRPPDGEDWDVAIRTARRVQYNLLVESEGIAMEMTFDAPPCVSNAEDEP